MTVTDDHRDFYELSPAEQSERADYCKEIEDRIIEGIARTRETLWHIAKNLHEFHVLNGWTALGIEKQEEWLAQPDIGISRQDYFKWRRMYRVMVLQHGLKMETVAGLEHSKVQIALPAIEDNRAPLEQILSDVKTLPARDLREVYVGSGIRGLRGGPPEETVAPPVATNGAGPHDDGHDDDPDVPPTIEGHATTIVDEPEEPAAAEAPAKAGPEEAAEDVDQKLVHAATVVDSWLELGGDRRKASRNWKTFVERHPVLEGVHRIQMLMDGDEDAPDRDTARGMWAYLIEALAIEFDPVDDGK